MSLLIEFVSQCSTEQLMNSILLSDMIQYLYATYKVICRDSKI